MNTLTNMMGDFTKALINADSIGFAALDKEYAPFADRTFHSEPGLGYNGPSVPSNG